MKIFITLIATAITLLLFIGLDTAHAATTKAKLKVLPMDCVFNFIDDGGQGIIVYITPAECGVDVPLPNPDTSSSPPLVPTDNVKNYLRLSGFDFTDEEILLAEILPQDERGPSSVRFVIDNHAPKSLEKNNRRALSFLSVTGGIALLLAVAYVTRSALNYSKN